jgi:hypothetical protein
VTTSTDPFSFEHEGRTFTCQAEGSPASARGRWWWFAVSTEAHQRHAPFLAADTDTADAVRDRIVAYYDALLVSRAAPRQNPWQSRGRPRPAAGVNPAPADAPAVAASAPAAG